MMLTDVVWCIGALLEFLSEPPALAGGCRHSTQQGTTDPPANAGGSDKTPVNRRQAVLVTGRVTDQRFKETASA